MIPVIGVACLVVSVPPAPLALDSSLLVAPPPGPTTAAEFLERGKKYTEQKLYHFAARDLAEAARLDPLSADVQLAVVKLHAAARDLRRALAAAEDAVRLAPARAECYRARAEVRADLTRYDEAWVDCDTALRLDPGYAPAWNTRGLLRQRRKDYAGADADFTEAIRLDPKSGVLRAGRASVRVRLGRLPDALSDADEAVRLEPDVYVTRGNRYEILRRLGRHADAAREADDLVRLNPRSPDPFLQRAAAKKDAGDPYAAVADYTAALTVAPVDQWNILLERGRAHYAAHDYAAAGRDFEAAYRAHAGTLPTVQLAIFLSTCPDAAHRDGARAVRLAKPQAEAVPYNLTFFALAAAYAETGDFTAAVRWQEKALADSGKLSLRQAAAGGTVTQELTYDPGAEGRAGAETVLAGYRAGQPWRRKP